MILILIVLPVLYFIISSLSPIGKYFYSITNNKRVWESLSDKFVLVISATSDFGAAVCAVLAKKKMKMILLDPSEDKLLELKARIGKQNNIFHHAIDLVNCTDFSFLDKYDIGLVINKIGSNASTPLHFIDQNSDQILNSELKAPLSLMKSIITSMAEKHKGYIVNVGFGPSANPSPHYALSSAIKCAFKSWSESMYYEMMPYNINVEYIEVNGLCQKDDKKHRWFCFSPTVETSALYVVKMLGSSDFTIPHIFDFIQFMVAAFIPKSILGRLKSYRNEERKRAAPY